MSNYNLTSAVLVLVAADWETCEKHHLKKGEIPETGEQRCPLLQSPGTSEAHKEQVDVWMEWASLHFIEKLELLTPISNAAVAGMKGVDFSLGFSHALLLLDLASCGRCGVRKR